jgi:AraC-like DNA-binding protein
MGRNHEQKVSPRKALVDYDVSEIGGIPAVEREAKRDASAFRVLLDLRERTGLTEEELLSGTVIISEVVYQPYAEIEMWQELRLIENLTAQHHQLPLALEAASKVHLTTMGTLGFGMLSSKNIFQALQLSAEFHSVSLWICDVATQVVSENVEFLLLSHSLPPACRDFCSMRGVASLKTWFNEMLGREIIPTRIQCMAQTPSDTQVFEEYFGCPVEFEADAYSISFATSLFTEPLKFADKWAWQRCELELRELKDRRRASFTNRVRDLISFAPKVNHSEESVSQALRVSGSTLRRRLREEGTTYREVRAETLHSLARVMLASSSRTVEEVADILGYSESASFVRSFKRREKVAPGPWRKAERQSVRE